MKEKIYTIPVTEAFRTECECPMCILEKKLENEYVEYYLGPALMEPDHRMETNDKGFCRRHFEQLFNKQENKLGLALIIDTHLTEQNAKMDKLLRSRAEALRKDSDMPVLKSIAGKLSSKQTETGKFADELIEELEKLEGKCAVCSKLEHTMDRYVDVILYLWLKEQDFREMFNSRKGFCLRHFKELAIGTKKYLGTKDAAVFLRSLAELQLQNLARIREEVNWFTRKFDYRNNDAPWGNSRDALQRSIQKLVGYCELK
jgi:hypothetical protein